MSDPVLYILMRTDMDSMNPGKAMAQAAHAANQFVYEMTEFGREAYDPDLVDLYDVWSATEDVCEKSLGFGTTIVLDGIDQYNIEDVVRNTSLSVLDDGNGKVFSGVVYDPTYPIRIPNEEVSFLIPNDEDTAPRVYSPKDGSVTIFRNVLTCGYVFGIKDEVEQFVSHLQLHP